MVRARRRCRGRRTVYPGVSEGGTFSRNTRGGFPVPPLLVVQGAGRGGGCGVLLPRCCRNWSAVNTNPPPPTAGAGRGGLLCAPRHVKIHGGCQQDNGLETISGASGCRRQT